MLPELECIFKRYLVKGNPREYNRFVHFSAFITQNRPQYYLNYCEVDKWMTLQRENKAHYCNSEVIVGLKILDIYSIIEYYSSLGLPKCHTAAKRFSECLKVWLAAYWDEYGPIMKGAIKIKALPQSRIEVNMSRESISAIAEKTGVILMRFSDVKRPSRISIFPKSTVYVPKIVLIDPLENFSVRNLLNHHTN